MQLTGRVTDAAENLKKKTDQLKKPLQAFAGMNLKM